MIPPARLGENAPGGFDGQWLCITGPHYKTADPTGMLCAPSASHEPTIPAGYISVAEAMAYLSLSESAVTKSCREGKFPSVKVGRRVYLVEAAINRARVSA